MCSSEIPPIFCLRSVHSSKCDGQIVNLQCIVNFSHALDPCIRPGKGNSFVHRLKTPPSGVIIGPSGKRVKCLIIPKGQRPTKNFII